MKLAGKTAIVTGGSKGLGRSMAQGLAEAGAHVVVCSRDAGAVQAVAEELTQTCGQSCRGYACDVRSGHRCSAI